MVMATLGSRGLQGLKEYENNLVKRRGGGGRLKEQASGRQEMAIPFADCRL